ncbi:TPA: hypothetical protein N0F65_006879 [Lagenidium giganteum]|uniref:Uncharacterized protein n=1 Tax=Lagenidium giganteum TaxID=4803 RepID=A0AAV2ZIS8_9STRA|nr:TPA: hypothetical protein N0F65_006879 [Lagenidium giganteum]
MPPRKAKGTAAKAKAKAKPSVARKSVRKSPAKAKRQVKITDALKRVAKRKRATGADGSEVDEETKDNEDEEEDEDGSTPGEDDDEGAERGSRGSSWDSAGKRGRARNGKDDVALEDVLTGSYLTTASNTSDLSRKLKQTFVLLQRMGNQQQEDVALEQLRLVCAELLHETIMENTEKNVRSLAACCFVELMRIYAPDMPFKSNEELYDAFQLLLEQLRLLAIESDATTDGSVASSSCDLHYFHVLESLATVKSCVLLIGMDFVAEDGEEQLLVQLFKTLFETVQKEHSVKIEQLMLSIMATCIEESDTMDQALLDTILAPLLQPTPHDGSAADGGDCGPYKMARELIQRTSDHLQSHLSHYFNSILVDAPSAVSLQKTSELKEHVYTLIYEVHKVNASLLMYVLPNVCMQLQVDEVATRSDAIALMGRLFASSHADYGQQHMKIFRSFLGRFRDVSKEIRLQMVQVCAIIWERKPELGSTLETEFIQRLADPEWEVRRLVVNEVCDLAMNNIELVSYECLHEVGERVKDKKVVLRKETMTGLSQVYAKYISTCWKEEKEAGGVLKNPVPAELAKKLGWVPDYVLKCFAYPQEELKLRVIQLLDDILLPKAFTDAARAKGVLYIFRHLDNVSKEALRRILNERCKCLAACRSLVLSKKEVRKNNATTAGELEKAKDAFLDAIAPFFKETDNLNKLVTQFVNWKDNHLIQHLSALCDITQNHQETRSARDQLIKVVGSKTPLGEFAKNLCRKMNLLTINQPLLGTLLRFLSDRHGSFSRDNRSVTEILLLVSRTTPELFAPYVGDELEAIISNHSGAAEVEEDESDEDDEEAKDQNVVIGILQVLANFSDYSRKIQPKGAKTKTTSAVTPSDGMKKTLQQICLSYGNHQPSKKNSHISDGPKLAAICLANFYSSDKWLTSVILKISNKKKLSSPPTANTLAALQSLAVFAKRSSSSFSTRLLIEDLWATLVDDYLSEKSSSTEAPSKGKKGSKSGVALNAAMMAEIRCTAIKVAAHLLLFCEMDDEDKKQKAGHFTEMLLAVLRSDGRTWTSSPALAVKYRIAASGSLLKLMRSASTESTLSISDWHVLGFVMQDSDEEVRAAFIKHLTSHLMKQTVPHPHKYLSYLALAGIERNGLLKKQAANLLAAAVDRMRHMFETMTSSTQSTSDDEDDDDSNNTKSLSVLIVPEYSLPYVIHLLAHHPDFPEIKGERYDEAFGNARWNEQVAYLHFFLEGLVPASQAAEADNIAFLLQILTKLSECHDATSPGERSIYPLIDTCVGLLKRKIKNQSNLKAYPGKIYLPKHLFAPGKDSAVPSNGSAMSDAVAKRRVPRIATSLSPIKGFESVGSFKMIRSPPPKRKASPSSRRSSGPKSPASPAPVTAKTSTDNNATPTTPRRQSLMRKARTSVKTYVNDDSSSEDDMDAFVPNASVASRTTKRRSVGSVSPRVASRRNSRDAVDAAATNGDDDNAADEAEPSLAKKSVKKHEVDEEEKEENNDDDEEEMIATWHSLAKEGPSSSKAPAKLPHPHILALPAMASGTATVKAVLSGDTLVLMGAAKNGPPPELMLTLSSLNAPRLARSPEASNEPYAWVSREFLRKRVIGKQVRFKVEYRVAAINRDFGSVWITKDNGKEENLCVVMARAGLAKVKPLDQSRDGVCCDHEQMLQLEQQAITEKRGMYADADDRANVTVKYSGAVGDALLDEFKGKLVPAIVESVRDGASMRVVLKPNMFIVNFGLAGVQCPRMAPPVGTATSVEAIGPAPHAREAKHFTETRLLHRDVELKLEGVDKYGNLYGSVVHSSGKNISVELLKSGLGKMADWSSSFVSSAARSAMRAAEKEAKTAGLRVWRDYQAPVLQSDKQARGVVVEVISGDCVVVYLPEKNEEKRIYLSSLRAPRMGNPRRSEPNAPYAQEAKEFLRQKAIGKNVLVEVEYEKTNPALGDNQLMTFASLLVESAKKPASATNKGWNLAVEVVGAGFAEVVRHRPDEEKSEYYDDLVTAETKAQTQKKGMYSGKEAPEHRYTDLCFDATKAKQYLPFLKREKSTRAVVEYIYSGTRVKLFIPKENCMINFVVAGIKCPQPTRYGGQGVVSAAAEPFGEDSKMFTKRSIMQRNVIVEIEDMDRGGNAFGPLYVNGGKDEKNNFGCHLLAEGLAWVDQFSVERTSTGAELQRAEEAAKQAKKNYWKNYDAAAAAAKAQATTQMKTSDDVMPAVKLSEIVNGTHFFIQNVADRTYATVEEKMKEFTRQQGTQGKTLEIRRNTVCAGLFDDGNGPLWNRAKVEYVNADGSARVRFIDYGNVATLPPNRLRPLDAAVTQYPPQAKECVFGFIKPMPATDEFGQDAAHMLGDIAWGHTLTARVHGTDDQNRLIVSLYKNNQSVSETILEAGVIRTDRKALVRVAPHQKTVVDGLIKAQTAAKKKRVCLWRYGDIESDED